MTVIAYRDGMMAADRQGFCGSTKANTATKIGRRDSDGALIGASGNASLCAALLRWFLDGEQGERPKIDFDKDNNAGALVVRPNGAVEIHDVWGWHPCEGPYHATGCGSDFALAAMEMGASAERAVEVTIKLEAYTGGGVDVVCLGKAEG